MIVLLVIAVVLFFLVPPLGLALAFFTLCFAVVGMARRRAAPPAEQHAAYNLDVLERKGYRARP